MRSVTYIGVDGSVWPLTSWDHRGVFLGAAPDEIRSDADGEPLQGSLSVVIADNSPEGAPLDPICVTERAWRRAWSKRRWGTLRVESDAGQTYWVKVKLAATIPGFSELEPEGFVEFTQEIVADSPVWWHTLVRTGPKVVLTNAGDVDVWVRIRWRDAGRVTMPSNAVFILPAVPGPRVITLDPKQSCVVRDDNGVIDETTWKALRGVAFPEVVPAGETREFMVPADASVIMDEGVDSPW